MSRYLLLWELDPAKVPADRKERAALWGPMIQMVKQQIKDGSTKDWGAFAGGLKGFSVVEGDEMRLSENVQKYLPYVTFTAYPVITIDQMAEVIENLKK
jgi:hypothetical protein